VRPRRGKRYGIPTGEPVPQAVDPASGFKVPLSNLVRQWDNQLVDRRFVDKRNPQDFVRGIKEDVSLPYARPEAPDIFIALPLLWQDGALMFAEDGRILLTEGINPLETL
jgi:hypothetical protein